MDRQTPNDFDEFFDVCEYVFYSIEKIGSNSLRKKWNLIYSMAVVSKYLNNNSFTRFHLGGLIERIHTFIIELSKKIDIHDL